MVVVTIDNIHFNPKFVISET